MEWKPRGPNSFKPSGLLNRRFFGNTNRRLGVSLLQARGFVPISPPPLHSHTQRLQKARIPKRVGNLHCYEEMHMLRTAFIGIAVSVSSPGLLRPRTKWIATRSTRASWQRYTRKRLWASK